MNKADELHKLANDRALAKLAANHPNMDAQSKLYFKLLDEATTRAGNGLYSMILGDVQTVPVEVAIKLRHDGFGIKMIQHNDNIVYEMSWAYKR